GFLDGTLIVGGGLVAYNASAGKLESLNPTTEYASNLFTLRNTNPNANVRVTNTTALPQAGSVAGLFAPTTVNALVLSGYSTFNIAPPVPSPWRRTEGFPSVLGTGTLTVGSGAIVTGSFGPDFSVLPAQINVANLNFGSVTGYLHGSGTVNSPISGAGGLVVAGGWTLSSLSSTFTGGVTVNGSLTIANDANLGPAGNSLILNGSLNFAPEALYGTGLGRTLTVSRPITLETGGSFATYGSGGSLSTSANPELIL